MTIRHILEHWQDLHVPFMLAVGQAHTVSRQRIIEAVIIAILTAAITTYFSLYVGHEIIKIELQHIKEDIERARAEAASRMDRIENRLDVKR